MRHASLASPAADAAAGHATPAQDDGIAEVVKDTKATRGGLSRRQKKRQHALFDGTAEVATTTDSFDGIAEKAPCTSSHDTTEPPALIDGIAEETAATCYFNIADDHASPALFDGYAGDSEPPGLASSSHASPVLFDGDYISLHQLLALPRFRPVLFDGNAPALFDSNAEVAKLRQELFVENAEVAKLRGDRSAALYDVNAEVAKLRKALQASFETAEITQSALFDENAEVANLRQALQASFETAEITQSALFDRNAEVAKLQALQASHESTEITQSALFAENAEVANLRKALQASDVSSEITQSALFDEKAEVAKLSALLLSQMQSYSELQNLFGTEYRELQRWRSHAQ